MSSPLTDKIASANSTIAPLLADARLSLTGQKNFDVDLVRAIAEPVSQMRPVMARAKELRLLQPEIEGELDVYTSQITELREVLENVRMMLLARRASLEATRSQLAAVGFFTDALSRTRP